MKLLVPTVIAAAGILVGGFLSTSVASFDAISDARINIHAARPGIIIGKKGAEVEALRREIQTRFAPPAPAQAPRPWEDVPLSTSASMRR